MKTNPSPTKIQRSSARAERPRPASLSKGGGHKKPEYRAVTLTRSTPVRPGVAHGLERLRIGQNSSSRGHKPARFRPLPSDRAHYLNLQTRRDQGPRGRGRKEIHQLQDVTQRIRLTHRWQSRVTKVSYFGFLQSPASTSVVEQSTGSRSTDSITSLQTFFARLRSDALSDHNAIINGDTSCLIRLSWN